MEDRTQGKQVRVAGLPKFEDEAKSEASDAKSPLYEETTGDEVSKGVVSEVDKASFK